MGKFTEYKISLKSMPAGEHTYVFHPGKDFFVNMESPDVHDASLEVTLTVNHANGVYDMNFAIAGTVTLLCDRCLDTLVMPVDAHYHVAVEYGDDYNDESDDVLIIPESDPALNVAYMIYDTVALSIPIKHVHPAGQCNRAMSSLLKRHGATRATDADEEALEEQLIDEIDTLDDDDAGEAPTDPRWDALKKLNDNNNTTD